MKFREELAQTMHELEIEREALFKDPSRLRVLFEEMLQMCLWYVFLRFTKYTTAHIVFRGNATVRSLIYSPSLRSLRLARDFRISPCSQI
jgi:hypothetical protein